jgi:hypothetical protein
MYDDIFKKSEEENNITENSLDEKLKLSDLEILPPKKIKLKNNTKYIDVEENGDIIRFLSWISNLSFVSEYEEDSCNLYIKGCATISKYTIKKKQSKKLLRNKMKVNVNKEQIWSFDNVSYLSDRQSTIMKGTINSNNISKININEYKKDIQKVAKSNGIFITSKLLDLVFDPIEEKVKEQYMHQARREKEFIDIISHKL